MRDIYEFDYGMHQIREGGFGEGGFGGQTHDIFIKHGQNHGEVIKYRYCQEKVMNHSLVE